MAPENTQFTQKISVSVFQSCKLTFFTLVVEYTMFALQVAKNAFLDPLIQILISSTFKTITSTFLKLIIIFIFYYVCFYKMACLKFAFRLKRNELNVHNRVCETHVRELFSVWERFQGYVNLRKRKKGGRSGTYRWYVI